MAKGRYDRLTPHHATARDGRKVPVLPPAPRQRADVLGYHQRKEAERLDQMAARYLANPAGFWRIADVNDAMLPDALDQVDVIAIPKGKG